VNRIRVQATIDRDAASPDSIAAAQRYLTAQMTERAENIAIALNWNTFRTYVRPNRHGDLILTQWAKVVR
jgi:hypothetical protein